MPQSAGAAAAGVARPAGVRRPARRVARVGAADKDLLDNPQKTLFQSPGESAFKVAEPVLDLRALEKEVRAHNFCHCDVERILLRQAQTQLRGLLGELDADRWRFEKPSNGGF